LTRADGAALASDRDQFENMNGTDLPYIGGEILTSANSEVAHHLLFLSTLLGD
jgi:hypothetical protein